MCIRDRQGVEKPDWNEDPQITAEEIGENKEGCTPLEGRHGMGFPVNAYPILENALRHHLGRDVKAHLAAMGKLMSPFTQVAAGHPQAWFPTARTAEELTTPSPDNRWVGYPYPKYLNAIMQVDQAAAIVMTSVGRARELGIDESKWVYLHGCADANEIWYVSERPELHRSHAMQGIAQTALAMAGWTIDEIDYFDLYSCFPSAVQVACREMGIDMDCLLYTSPSPRDATLSRMPSSA